MIKNYIYKSSAHSHQTGLAYVLIDQSIHLTNLFGDRESESSASLVRYVSVLVVVSNLGKPDDIIPNETHASKSAQILV
jgi:hypothetical protein